MTAGEELVDQLELEIGYEYRVTYTMQSYGIVQVMGAAGDYRISEIADDVLQDLGVQYDGYDQGNNAFIEVFE
jgi:hypothetical protein